MESIQQIKMRFEECGMEAVPELLAVYGQDSRKGVQKLLCQYRKKHGKLLEEQQRIENMLAYEREYRDYAFIAGVDEAGRGPLAGPVVAAAVILPKDARILYLNDSKKLTAAKREELYEVIMKEAVSVGVGQASPETIDRINILQATYLAMKEALTKLSPAPDLLLNDAVTIPGVGVEQVPIIKGDGKSLSIAAASVIAKVTRDRMMVMYDSLYPEYGFAGHKGYGSEKHILALKEYGPCPIHRRSFILNFVGGPEIESTSNRQPV